MALESGDSTSQEVAGESLLLLCSLLVSVHVGRRLQGSSLRGTRLFLDWVIDNGLLGPDHIASVLDAQAVS